MENNFYEILFTQVNKNKEKFLGVLRRNGVLVNTNINNIDLTTMLLKAMEKSESFKKELVFLLALLVAENDDSNFSNYINPFSSMRKFDENALSGKTSSNSKTDVTVSESSKKPFEETNFAKYFDKLLTLGNTYLRNKELDVRKLEAQVSETIVTENDDKKKPPQPPKSNTGLYIGLTIGGLALVGGLVYLISKKK